MIDNYYKTSPITRSPNPANRRETMTKTLSRDDIHELCTEFVNDPDTTVGMECNWLDYLVQKIPLPDFSAEQIMQALDLSSDDTIVCKTVEHQNYGGTHVYLTIHDGYIMVSTKLWLLK